MGEYPILTVIFNPRSGQRAAAEDLAIIGSKLAPHFQLRIVHTKDGCDPADMAREACESGAAIVVAAGGDGTVSQVAGSLMGTKVPLGVIPRGTANAFASALGIDTTFDPVGGACDIIARGQTRQVDVALADGRPLILLAGIGFEAETIDRATRESKDQWGPFAYFIAGWEQLNEQRLFETHIEIDGEQKSFRAAAITVANAAPPTSVLAQGKGFVEVDDGLLDITIASAESITDAVLSMLDLFGAALIKAKPQEHPNIIHFNTRAIRIATDPPQKVVVDGEIAGFTPVEIRCIPKGLTVLAPPPVSGG